MRKLKSCRSISTYNRIKKKAEPNKTDTMAEMSELRGLASALMRKDKRKEIKEGKKSKRTYVTPKQS